MMQYANDVYGIVMNRVDDAMLIAGKLADPFAPHWLCLSDQRMVSKSFKTMFDFILISICRCGAKLCFAIVTDFNQIAASRPAQNNPSHAGRGALR